MVEDGTDKTKIRGIVPSMTIGDEGFLLGELDGVDVEEARARGKEYLADIEGTETVVVTQSRLREQVKQEKKRRKRGAHGRIRQ